MKYFTPERWARFQSLDDKRAFLAAHEDWEAAIDAYRADLARARPILPADLRRFSEEECLHDATLLGDWKNGELLHLLVQPEPPAEWRTLLVYSTVEPPHITISTLLREQGYDYAGWMYDEIGVEREPGGAPVFTHSILLRDGREITIRFREFTVSRLPPGLPDHFA